jgi:transposase
MARKLSLEDRMTIVGLLRRGWSRCAIARTLGVTEGAVRYHSRREESGAVDGRSRQEHLAACHAEVIAEWLRSRVDSAPLNLAVLHEHLVAEHGYQGSLRSVERYYRAHYPAPARRARRRVETPPGAQAQADWAEFPGVISAGVRRTLHAFALQLSFSRYDAMVWSCSEDQLSWHTVHNSALERFGGVPAVIRVDNVKTAVATGAGSWGELNESYLRYAQAVRFHIDVCAPYSPESKGKIERRIRDRRYWFDPCQQSWSDLAELQAATDAVVLRSSERRRCPATGTSVREAFEEERRHLGPLPILPEPFDVVVTRSVRPDCTVAFEGRSYSVPFALLGQGVEVRGCAGKVQIVAGGTVVASHPRHTAARVVLDPRHYEGEATTTVLPPLPLGRMGERLQEIWSLAPEQRPLDLYAALAEVAR